METNKGTAVLEKAFDLLEAIGLAAEGLDTQQLALQVNLPAQRYTDCSRCW